MSIIRHLSLRKYKTVFWLASVTLHLTGLLIWLILRQKRDISRTSSVQSVKSNSRIDRSAYFSRVNFDDLQQSFEQQSNFLEALTRMILIPPPIKSSEICSIRDNYDVSQEHKFILSQATFGDSCIHFHYQ